MRKQKKKLFPSTEVQWVKTAYTFPKGAWLGASQTLLGFPTVHPGSSITLLVAVAKKGFNLLWLSTSKTGSHNCWASQSYTGLECLPLCLFFPLETRQCTESQAVYDSCLIQKKYIQEYPQRVKAIPMFLYVVQVKSLASPSLGQTESSMLFL